VIKAPIRRIELGYLACPQLASMTIGLRQPLFKKALANNPFEVLNPNAADAGWSAH